MEGAFRPPPDAGFRLIETFLWTPSGAVLRQERHLARLRRTAARFDIALPDIETALAALQAPGPLRVRLTVSQAGEMVLAHQPFVALPEGAVWRLGLSTHRLSAGDPWLGVKTTQRALYDAARADLPEDLDEWLFCNEDGWLCEGTITNLFVDLGDGLLTPPLDCGVLPGILREDLLESGQAREARLGLRDLQEARALYVGNSLRGLIPAVLSAGLTPAGMSGGS